MESKIVPLTTWPDAIDVFVGGGLWALAKTGYLQVEGKFSAREMRQDIQQPYRQTSYELPLYIYKYPIYQIV
jgi:hypothetical protein